MPGFCRPEIQFVLGLAEQREMSPLQQAELRLILFQDKALLLFAPGSIVLTGHGTKVHKRKLVNACAWDMQEDKVEGWRECPPASSRKAASDAETAPVMSAQYAFSQCAHATRCLAKASPSVILPACTVTWSDLAQ